MGKLRKCAVFMPRLLTKAVEGAVQGIVGGEEGGRVPTRILLVPRLG
jgi:hypothetical protein